MEKECCWAQLRFALLWLRSAAFPDLSKGKTPPYDQKKKTPPLPPNALDFSSSEAADCPLPDRGAIWFTWRPTFPCVSFLPLNGPWFAWGTNSAWRTFSFPPVLSKRNLIRSDAHQHKTTHHSISTAFLVTGVLMKSQDVMLWCDEWLSEGAKPLNLRLMSWCMMLCECRYSSPRRTCWVTQMISNSRIGPQLSSFSKTEPPSPASMKRCTLWSHNKAPYSSAMFSCRNLAWISTSAGLKCSKGICTKLKRWREAWVRHLFVQKKLLYSTSQVVCFFSLELWG